MHNNTNEQQVPNSLLPQSFRYVHFSVAPPVVVLPTPPSLTTVVAS